MQPPSVSSSILTHLTIKSGRGDWGSVEKTPSARSAGGSLEPSAAGEGARATSPSDAVGPTRASVAVGPASDRSLGA